MDVARDVANVARPPLILSLRKSLPDGFGVVLAQSFRALVDDAFCVLNRLRFARLEQ